MSTRLIAYLRVSRLGDRDSDAESFQSIDQQREAVAAIVALTRGAQVIDEVVALNASGGKTWPEPKLAAAIARVEAGDADGIVVYALDRWGRHMAALQVIERWADAGRMFLSASDKFDASTPSGRMALRMMMAVASYYWESTRDRFAQSQERAIRRGAYIGGAPLGYRRGDGGRLVPDPTMAPIIRQAFRVAARDGLHAATDHLRDAVPDRRWETSDARRLLGMRAYLGESRLGDLANPEAHEPLASLAVWEAAQTEPRLRRSNGRYPLSGIATCECGAPLVGAVQTVRGRRYRRYRCSAKACRGGCSIRAETLEDHVAVALAAAIGDRRLLLSMVPDGLQDAADALDRAQADRDRWAADDRARDAMGDASWYAGLERRAAAVKAAHAAYQTIASASARLASLPTADEIAFDRDANGTPIEAEGFARVVGAMCDRIEVRRGRGTIGQRVQFCWRGQLAQAADDLALAA